MSTARTYELINTALECLKKVNIDDIPAHYSTYVELLQLELEDLRDIVVKEVDDEEDELW